MRLIALALVAFGAANAHAGKSSEWQDLRKQIRKTLHVPEDLPALREKSYGQFNVAPNVVAERVSYTTDYDLRVPAIVYHQPGATIAKHPALVIVNGHGGDKSSGLRLLGGDSLRASRRSGADI